MIYWSIKNVHLQGFILDYCTKHAEMDIDVVQQLATKANRVAEHKLCA
jgi:hypothetical protein